MYTLAIDLSEPEEYAFCAGSADALTMPRESTIETQNRTKMRFFLLGFVKGEVALAIIQSSIRYQ